MFLKRFQLVCLAALFLYQFTASKQAHAGGFLLPETTGESVGKAAAMIASVQEPSAMWYNPAAMSFMPGYQFSAGGILLFPRNEFTPEKNGEKVDSAGGTFFLPAFFGTFQILDWLHAGIAVHTPIGMGIKWPADWVGREHTIEVSMATLYLSPGLSFKLWKDMLSLGIGFSAVKGSFESTTGVPEVIGGDVHFGADTWSYGGNIALMYRPFPEKFHVALIYRSRVKLAFDGKMDVSLDAEEFGKLMPDQGAKTELWLPDIVALGLMFRPMKPLEISLDFNMLFYSTFDKFEVEMADGTVNTMDRNWKNVFMVKLGIQYELPVGLKLRVGFAFDQNPVPENTRSADLPESYRINEAIGVGYEYKWFKADVGYLFSYFLPAKSKTGREGPAGEYKSHAHLLGLTLGVKLGGKASEPVPPSEEPAAEPGHQWRGGGANGRIRAGH